MLRGDLEGLFIESDQKSACGTESAHLSLPPLAALPLNARDPLELPTRSLCVCSGEDLLSYCLEGDCAELLKKLLMKRGGMRSPLACPGPGEAAELLALLKKPFILG